MADKTISIGFKIEDDGKGFKQLTLDAESFKKAMSGAVGEAGK